MLEHFSYVCEKSVKSEKCKKYQTFEHFKNFEISKKFESLMRNFEPTFSFRKHIVSMTNCHAKIDFGSSLDVNINWTCTKTKQVVAPKSEGRCPLLLCCITVLAKPLNNPTMSYEKGHRNGI